MITANSRLEAILEARLNIATQIASINSKLLQPLYEQERKLALEMAEIVDPGSTDTIDLIKRSKGVQ